MVDRTLASIMTPAGLCPLGPLLKLLAIFERWTMVLTTFVPVVTQRAGGK